MIKRKLKPKIKPKIFLSYGVVGVVDLILGTMTGVMTGVNHPLRAEVTIAPGTLPVDSQVLQESPTANTTLYRIQGGTVAGQNLFHSLQTFGLTPSETARFEPSSEISRIITRVVGSDRSLLEGRIQIQQQNPVDLYILNPNGIILGNNAVLDFNGAFIGSSSDRLLFEDGTIFNTSTDLPPLLTVSVPVGLQFGTPSTLVQINQGTLSLENELIEGDSGTIFHLIGEKIDLKNTQFNLPQADVYVHSLSDLTVDGVSNLAFSSLFASNAFNDLRLKSAENLRVTNSLLVAAKSFVLDSQENVELSNVFFDTGTSALTATLDKIADIEVYAQGKILGNRTDSGETLDAFPVILVTSTLNSIDSGNVIFRGESDIELSNTFLVATSLYEGNSGSIDIQSGGNLLLDNGTFLASDSFTSSLAGLISLKATGNITLDNVSALASNSFGRGSGSEIQVDAGGHLLLDRNSLISTNTSDQGNAGSIRVTARQGNIILQAGGTIAASTFSSGNAGSVFVDAGNDLKVEDGYIYSLTSGSGQGGQISLTADKRIELTQGSTVTTAATFLATGQSGNIQIQAGEAIVLEGQNQPFAPVPLTASSPIYLEQEAIGVDTNAPVRGSQSPLGRAEPVSDRFFLAESASDYLAVFQADQFPFVSIRGNISPDDRQDFYQLDIQEPGTTLIFDVDNTDQALNAYLFIANSTNLVLGTSREAVAIDLGSDRNKDPNFGFIFPSAGTYFIAIQPDDQLPDSSPPLTTPVAYTLNISRISPQFTNTRISSQTENRSAAGNITLQAPLIQLKTGASLQVNSQGSGPGGNIDITGQRLELIDQSVLTAETRSNQGGNLTINLSQWLQLQNGSSLSATAGTDQTGGDGGNINLTVPLLIALPRQTNAISANAFSGKGGNILIKTNSILGDRFLTISASSQLGIDGAIDIQLAGLDLESLLALLSDQILDVSDQIAANCRSSTWTQNRFVVLGRSGLPTDPRHANPRDALIADLRWPTGSSVLDDRGTEIQNTEIQKAKSPQASPAATSLREAQTWVQTNGSIQLVAQPSPSGLPIASGLPACTDMNP